MYSQTQWENFCKLQDEMKTNVQNECFYNWVKANDNEFKLHKLLGHIHEALDHSSYQLKDKKAFKDEFATFIYKITYDA